VVDEVHGLVDLVVRRDVEHPEVEARVVGDVLDVAERPGFQIVHADHAVPTTKEVVAEVGAEESGAAGDQ